MKKIAVYTVVAVTFLALGCGARIKAPTTPDGGKIEIVLLSDRGYTDEMTGDQVAQRDQLGEWMEGDLISILGNAGYLATQITSREEFTPGPGRYLLTIAVVNYNPGSKAARMMVGFGAGSVSLDTHYELFSEEAAAILADDHGVASSRDWNYCARKLNEQTAQAITNKLKAM